MKTSKLERLARRIGVAKLAKRIGRSASTVYGWIRRGEVPPGAADVVGRVVKRSEDARRRARERAERERLEQERAEREKRKRAKERAAKKKAEEADAAKRAKEAAAKKKAEEAQRAKEQAERERLAREERERAEAKRKADAERQQRKREREAERRRAEETEAEAERRRAEEAARPPRRPPAPPRAPAPPPPSPVRVLTREQAEALRAAGLVDAFPWREETQDERDAREEREAIQAEAERESRVSLIQRRIFAWARELPVSRGVSAMRVVDDGLVGTRRRETVLGLLVYRHTRVGSLVGKFDAGNVDLAWTTRAGFAATVRRLDEVGQVQRSLIDWARGQYTTAQHEVTQIRFDGGQLVGVDEFGVLRRAFLITGGAANVSLETKIARTPKISTAFNQPSDGVTLYWEVAERSLEALERGVSRREDEYEDLSPRTTVTDFSVLWEGKQTVTTDFSPLWEDEE